MEISSSTARKKNKRSVVYSLFKKIFKNYCSKTCLFHQITEQNFLNFYTACFYLFQINSQNMKNILCTQHKIIRKQFNYLKYKRFKSVSLCHFKKNPQPTNKYKQCKIDTTRNFSTNLYPNFITPFSNLHKYCDSY